VDGAKLPPKTISAANDVSRPTSESAFLRRKVARESKNSDGSWKSSRKARQPRVGGLRRCSQYCPFCSLRKPQGNKIFFRKQIILAHLIDHADQTMFRSSFVWDQNDKSCVPPTKQHIPCSRCTRQIELRPSFHSMIRLILWSFCADPVGFVPMDFRMGYRTIRKFNGCNPLQLSPSSLCRTTSTDACAFGWRCRSQ